MSVKFEMRRLKICVIGKSSKSEFVDICQLMTERAETTCYVSVPEATAALAVSDEPDLIVLLQSFAGEFSRVEVEQLSTWLPLSPVICLLGSYSEGETRSGRSLPCAHRLFWYDSMSRLEAGLDCWQKGICPWWSLPATVSPEEHWLQRAAHPPSKFAGRLTGQIAIFAARKDVAAPNMELLARCGADPVFVGPQSSRPECLDSIQLAVWDAVPAGRRKPIPLEIAVEWAWPAAVISLRTFPRTQDVAADRAAGATIVLPRLTGADDFLWHVSRCINKAAESAQAIKVHDPAA